ncbi:aspartate dehydrogenase domain-containing protein [Clostridium sp. Marseille-P299]|uniref:aspartate dehydrogenase domain-containing protein n=1 Tax=Clostridium sp. Marseille-P299 TaxID=1805477 RepID=UPI000829A61E|nr:aspartate dehydrogenase domain-containing protein [Clostridium sp. Marseille-P299]
MKKLKLALIGCGYLNEIVANALKDGYLPEYELIAVLGRNYDRAKAFAEHFGCKVCADINELMEMKPDYIAEAASVKAVKDYTETVLNGGSNLVVLSIGAFADQEFYERVKNTAAKNNRRVHIASGAVGGFDVLRTAALMSPITASISSQKAPGSLYYTPLYKEGLLDITEKKQVFTGTTKEAIAILPTHVNVAVATALASAGPENTIMNIDAVPGFKGDEYKIEIQGDEVRTELNIYSRTSKVAAWSVVAVLQNVVAPIVF